MQQVSEEKFDVSVDESLGSIEVSTQSEPRCVINIKLTSPVMREEVTKEEEQGSIVSPF